MRSDDAKRASERSDTEGSVWVKPTVARWLGKIVLALALGRWHGRIFSHRYPTKWCFGNWELRKNLLVIFRSFKFERASRFLLPTEFFETQGVRWEWSTLPNLQVLHPSVEWKIRVPIRRCYYNIKNEGSEDAIFMRFRSCQFCNYYATYHPFLHSTNLCNVTPPRNQSGPQNGPEPIVINGPLTPIQMAENRKLGSFHPKK